MLRALIIAFTAMLLLPVGMEARATKKAAKTKKPSANIETLFEEADQALMMYNLDDLDQKLSTLESELGSRPSAENADRLQELRNRSLALRNMLQRVEQVVIVDSMTVDTATFFSHYRLAAESGRIDGTGLLTSFTPAVASEVFFTQAAANGKTRIMTAGILDDGTRENPRPLDLSMGKASTAYPFQMSDGVTLYFASDADTDGSLGGLDIYMTRRNGEGGYYEPTNMGMPYNSPANDYMMAIDEATGLGWWATDRSAPDGMVTIYVFVPNQTRVNYDPTRADIADRAFITSVAATQPRGFNKAAALAPLQRTSATADSNAPAWRLSIPGRGIYTSLDNFQNPAAAAAMEQYLETLTQAAQLEKSLHENRLLYARGRKDLASTLRTDEATLRTLRTKLTGLRNGVIRLER